MKKSTNETMKNNAKTTKNTNTRKEEKTMENKKTNEIAKCDSFLPAINNAVNHYCIDMTKTETILKTERNEFNEKDLSYVSFGFDNDVHA